MGVDLNDACLARVRTSDVPRLAELRCRPGVELALLSDAEAWLKWRAGDTDSARAVFSLSGCELFETREGRWHRLGCDLPAFDVPRDLDFRPLFQVLLPHSVLPLPVPAKPIRGIAIRLVPETHPREPSAVLVPCEACLRWIETIPNLQLEKYRGVRRGNDLLIVGRPVPWFEKDQRFWGDTVLTPLGLRPDPMLAEAELKVALGVSAEDWVVLAENAVETISATAWSPLSRAKLRWAARTP